MSRSEITPSQTRAIAASLDPVQFQTPATQLAPHRAPYHSTIGFNTTLDWTPPKDTRRSRQPKIQTVELTPADDAALRPLDLPFSPLEPLSKADPIADRKTRAVAAVLAGANIRQAALAAGVHRATLYAWARQDLQFRNEFEKAKLNRFQLLHEDLQYLKTRALEAIDAALNDQQPHVRLRAASLILDGLTRTAPQKPKLKPGAIDDDTMDCIMSQFE
jgi:transposase-like protein